MEFVDKNKGKARAHQLLKGFLERCLTQNPYPADLYEAMKHDVDPDPAINPNGKFTYNLLLEWILCESHLQGVDLNEEEGYCCYCMRTIKASETHSTLEHVIPKTVTNSTEYGNYFKVPSELEKDERVMALKTVFAKKYHSQALPCPHNVAYENLVASCDGSLPKGSDSHTCCNGPRGNQEIPPLMFMKDIHDEVEYRPSGGVVWNNNQNVDKRERARIINQVLRLNNDILRMVRMIWYYLSSKGIGCQLDATQRRRVIDTLRQEKCDGIYKDVIQNFLQDNYWCLLEEYRYFNDVTKFT